MWRRHQLSPAFIETTLVLFAHPNSDHSGHDRMRTFDAHPQRNGGAFLVPRGLQRLSIVFKLRHLDQAPLGAVELLMICLTVVGHTHEPASCPKAPAMVGAGKESSRPV